MNVGDILVSTLQCSYHGRDVSGEECFGHELECHAYEVVALDMSMAVLREIQWAQRREHCVPEAGRFIGTEEHRRPIEEWEWGEYVEWPMEPFHSRPREIAALWYPAQQYPAFMVRNARVARMERIG